MLVGSSTVLAQGLTSLLEDVNPLSELTDGAGAPEHAGLLGKMYLEARYVHIQINDFILPFDDTYQGFDVTFNAPMPWLTELVPIPGADIFFNFQQLQIGGTTGASTREMDVDSYHAGVSFYAAAFGPIRPFVQLGVQHDVVDFFAAGPGGAGNVDVHVDDTSFLAIVGLEADLADNTAVRVAIDLNEQAFGAPPITAGLILWPHERVYLRAGLIATTDGSEIGGLFGGGVVF